MQYRGLKLESCMLMHYTAFAPNKTSMLSLHFRISNSSKPLAANMLYTQNISGMLHFRISTMSCNSLKPISANMLLMQWSTTAHQFQQPPSDLEDTRMTFPGPGPRKSCALSRGNSLCHSLYILHYQAIHPLINHLARWTVLISGVFIRDFTCFVVTASIMYTHI